jgi:tetratricopeptide (TPR) repeat protein
LVPADGEPYYLSGVVYQRWQKLDTAYEFYGKAAERSPAELSYVLAQSEMLVAMNRINDALLLLQARVTYFEHSGAIRDAVGQLMMQQGRFAEAVAMLREASILAEDDPGIHERLALALYRNKDYREASEVISGLVQTDPFSKRVDMFTLLGECQLQLSRPREARASFETASQLDPYSAHTWQCLGRAALETGDFRRAEIALTKSLSVDNAAGETHLLLGYVRLREDRLADALASFKKASALDHTDTVSLCMVGYAFQKLGNPDAANQCYSKALKLNPGDEMARQLISGLDLHD